MWFTLKVVKKAVHVDTESLLTSYSLFGIDATDAYLLTIVEGAGTGTETGYRDCGS